jgi:high-affinity K+ transport system ATPase subunit B
MVQRLSISIPDEMDDWLTKNNINKSKLYQKAVYQEMKKTMEQGKNPLLFVVCTGFVVMGVVLILSTFVPFLSDEVRIFLPLLGGLLAFTSSYAFFKEQKKYRTLKKE